MRKLDDRSRRRILMASSTAHADTDREAAILGGIARSMLATGTFNAKEACSWAEWLIGQSDMPPGNFHKIAPAVKCPQMPITTPELQRALGKWQQAYLDATP